MTYCEETLVADLMVDCGDVHDPCHAWVQGRAEQLLAALAPKEGVEFVVRRISAAGPDGAPVGHWAVRAANNVFRRPQAGGAQQGALFDEGLTVWWSDVEIKALRRARKLVPAKLSGVHRCLKLAPPVTAQRKKRRRSC